MIVRYERRREFRVWDMAGVWYGVETNHIKGGKLDIPYNKCLRAESKDGIVDLIEAHCKFDDLVANGMDRAEAASLALFGE